MNRHTPLGRTTALRRTSKGARRQQATQRRACPLESYCYACGSSRELTRSHILTQKQHPKQAANPLNVLTLCWPCHSTWENNKARFARDYPEAWAETLRRMQLVDPQAHAFFRLKHPY